MISFIFNANEPCTAAVFFAAREHLELDSSGQPCRITFESKVESNAVETRWAAGMKQQFCQAAGQGLNMRLHTEYLRNDEHEVFIPLVVRLEALEPCTTGGGHQNGSDADQQRPGGCRNAQCTYATFKLAADGTYKVQVLKQKLLVRACKRRRAGERSPCCVLWA